MSKRCGSESVGLRQLVVLVAGVAMLAGWAGRSYADKTKQNNSEILNLGSSWVGGVAPGAGEVAIFDNTLSLTTSSNLAAPAALNADFSILGIKVGTPLGGPTLGQAVNQNGILISNAAGVTPSLILGSAGIDLSDATNSVPLGVQTKVLISADQTWNVADVSSRITAPTGGTPVGNVASGSLSVFSLNHSEDLAFSAQALNAAF